MKDSAKDFFDRESRRYEEFAKTRDFVLSLQERVIPLLKGNVLDIGSGCVTDFKDGPFDLYVGMDISLGMLLGLQRERKMRAVCGDANTPPFRKGSFDTLIFRAVLHHLNPGGMPQARMEETIGKVFLEAMRLVRRDGKIVLIEPCLSPLIEDFERYFALPTRFVMRLLGLPYVFIFSIERLSVLLREAGWDILRFNQIRGTGKRWDWIIPILGLPFLKIPRWLSPSKVYLIEGRKR